MGKYDNLQGHDPQAEDEADSAEQPAEQQEEKPA